MSIAEQFLKFEKKPEAPKAPTDSTTKEVMSKPEVKRAKLFNRTLGDVMVSAEAQRIFNPALPPTKPKPPTAAMMDAGTASAMDTTGNWGTPARTA